MERHIMFTDWRMHIVKMSILPKVIYSFNVIPIKIPNACFSLQKFLKSWNLYRSKKKNLWITKAIWARRKKAGSITLPGFKIYYKAALIKTYCPCIKIGIHTYIPKDHNSNSRSKFIHLLSTDLLWECKEQTRNLVSSINGLAKTENLHAEELNWKFISNV